MASDRLVFNAFRAPTGTLARYAARRRGRLSPERPENTPVPRARLNVCSQPASQAIGMRAAFHNTAASSGVVEG